LRPQTFAGGGASFPSLKFAGNGLDEFVRAPIARRAHHRVRARHAFLKGSRKTAWVGFTLGRRGVGRQAQTAAVRATAATIRSDVARITLPRRQIRGGEIIFSDLRDRIRDMLDFSIAKIQDDTSSCRRLTWG
jgi:hypothetical protein